MSSTNNGTITPPPQQINTGASGNPTSTDASSGDPLTQALLILEKKQRNLGKRKEKLESYEQEAKTGKELHKDQKEALAKYGEVIGQIECAKDLYEQFKKMQVDVAKIQKRTLKQAAEERRTQQAQRLREFVQLRYLLDHRPSSLKPEESSLLNDLARIVIPSDLSTNNLNRCVDAVVSIYQGGPPTSTIKGITGRNAQEVRETIEQLIKALESPPSHDTPTPQIMTTIVNEPVKQTPVMPHVPPTTPASVLPQRTPHPSTNNDVLAPSLTHAPPTTDINQVGQTQPLPRLNHPTEYPLQFDTRNQNIPLQQIMQDNPYFFVDNNSGNNSPQVLQDTSNNQQQQQIGATDEIPVAQSPDPKQYLQTFTVVNSSMAQTAPQGYSQTSAAPPQNNYSQETASAPTVSNDDQQQHSPEDQWQQRRGTGRGGGHYNNEAGQRNQYNRGGSHNYSQWRGPRGQRQQYPYNENNNRGGSGGQRPGPNPNYRGNRGGGYRGGNRGGYNPGAENYQQYQKSSHYQQNNGQQVRSAPPSQQQQQ